MTNNIRETYLLTIDARFAPMVVRLDECVRAAATELAPKISYGILMYGLNRDYRNWVCAISATKKVVTLRFLWGTMLADENRLLRHGSTSMGNMDYASIDEIDEGVVDAYVREAVAKYEDYKVSTAKATKK